MCKGGSTPSLEYTTTSTLTLVYDTMPPLLVTNVAALSSSTLVPGNVISLTFNEELQCAMPYALVAQLKYGESVLYDIASADVNTVLPMRCVGGMLSVQIPTDITKKLQSRVPAVSLPASLTLRLSNVADINGNKRADDVFIIKVGPAR